MKLIVLFALFGSIAAHLRDHANKIYIGSALAPSHFTDAQYSTIAAEEFNSLTPENEMKWANVEPSKGKYNYGPAEKLVEFAQQYDMIVRGHTLIWHQEVPDWVSVLSGDDLHEVMIDHITTLVTHFKGSIYAWDVLNEILDEDGSFRKTIWYNNFQTQYIADAFEAAAAADPDAKLYINDYSTEYSNNKSEALYNLVKELKSQGVPIHGVGFQTHSSVGKVPSDFASTLKKFTALGVEVAITELDIRLNGQSEDAQTEAFVEVVKDCVSVSGCVGVTFWEFIDKYSWISEETPCPWDSNYQAKPAVAAIEAVLE
ncbi:hypothetical protein ABEB36_012117 [Hypothenemus hampei]|uniref:endo-1,4-beta-xylanase n=1 Tax=Hypothenemus hampei TaxID=57062 RepID=A0ABD1EAF1_HYPHA